MRITIDLNDDGTIALDGQHQAVQWCIDHRKGLQIVLHNGGADWSSFGVVNAGANDRPVIVDGFAERTDSLK